MPGSYGQDHSENSQGGTTTDPGREDAQGMYVSSRYEPNSRSRPCGLWKVIQISPQVHRLQVYGRRKTRLGSVIMTMIEDEDP